MNFSGHFATNSQIQIDCLCSLGADRIEKTASNISSILACVDCLVMALVLLRVYKTVTYQWLFLWSLITAVRPYVTILKWVIKNRVWWCGLL
jgi:hypothetical protein